MKKALKRLKKVKHFLTKQQYNTFKGQIINGDVSGFYKGIYKVLANKKINLVEELINDTTI